MARKWFWAVAFLVCSVSVLWAQMAQRPLNPRTGFSAGVGYGTANPGTPHAGEIFVVTAGASDGGPLINIRDGVNAEWDELESMEDFFASLSLTADVLPKYDVTNFLENSRFFDDGSNIAIGQTTAPSSVIKFGDCSDAAGFGTDGTRFFACLDSVTNLELRNASANTGGYFSADSSAVKIGSYTATAFWLTIEDTLGLAFFDEPAAGASGTLAQFDRQVAAMDGSDEVEFLLLDVKSTNHTGGANSNTLVGLDVELNTTDTDALEVAIRVDNNWDISLLAADGSAGNPSISNNGDEDTGIRFPAANEVGFSTGGTAAFTYDANQMMRFETGTAFASLGTPANGTVAYCTDCNINTSPCTGGGNGAIAARLNGAWECL